MKRDDFSGWRERLRRRERVVSRERVHNYLPYLIRMADGVKLYFCFQRRWRVVLTEDLGQAVWWSWPTGGRDEGSLADLFGCWPDLGRDGRHWLMLTDRVGVATWYMSPYGWLTQREFAACLAGPGDDDEDGGGDESDEDDDEDDDWGIGRP